MDNISQYISAITSYAKMQFKKCFRKASGKLKYPFFVPGAGYAQELWDWDSWLTDIALIQIADNTDISEYQKGCVLNFLDKADKEGRIPINIIADRDSLFDLKPNTDVNIHKPCLCQHSLLISEKVGDAEWLRERFTTLERFLEWYRTNCYHSESGLYVWVNDFAIGIDNDPCVFYRPHKSTGSIFLNCLMYGELCAAQKLCNILGVGNSDRYEAQAKELASAIQRECWDERDGFFYSADVNLEPIDEGKWLHSGAPRHWNSLPMRIGVWAGFLPLYNGIATKEQAKRLVEHLQDESTFCANYGVRSLAKTERMYVIKPSSNPSCWLGPVWGNINYFVFEGLLRYGYTELAERLACKTVTLFGKDLEKCGEFHEYYHPDTGEGVYNQGFQSWNLLSFNMAQWLAQKSRSSIVYVATIHLP